MSVQDNRPHQRQGVGCLCQADTDKNEREKNNLY